MKHPSLTVPTKNREKLMNGARFRNAIRKAGWGVRKAIYGARSPKAWPSRESVVDYWQDPPDARNLTSAYQTDHHRAEYEEMVGFLKANGVPVKGPALEIGTNAGMGLKVMTEAGWTDLTGIEVNAKAVELMRNLYPDVAAAATVLNAPVEDAIPTLPDGHFELTWSKAVLLHIHPSSEWVFRDMVRVTRSHLLAVESEDVHGMKLFPRNYRDVFEGLGMEQVAETTMTTAPTYVARLFRHAT
jgi:hypothetical protein